jgi:cytochrome c-type biogenesis protein CcmF
VHAFGLDRDLAVLFTGFMILILVFSFAWMIYRLPLLRARNELDSWVSREAAFLANNWILLFSAFFVLFATMFPTLSEAVTGQRLTVGPPFFNRWMLPIGLALLALTGIGPLLAWRKSTVENLIHQFTWPVSAAVVTAGGLYALGVRVWSSGLCFALCAMVLATIAQEFIRGAQVRRSATGTDIFTALIALVGRSKRRYGGYIVHVGIVLMFLGFAGEGFKQEEQALLKVGERLSVGHFTIQHDALRVTSDGQKQMVTGHVSVFEDGKAIGALTPAKWYFNKHEQEPTTEVAIRRRPSEDVYVVLAGYNASDQTATYTLTINPLVNWIWLGFAIMAMGTGIAVMPDRAFAFAVTRVPAGAVTTSLMLMLALLPVSAWAQPQSSVAPNSSVRKKIHSEVMCTCGCRVAMNTCPMGPSCHGLQSLNPKIEGYIAQGMNREQILNALVADHGGQDILLAPIDKGFNRLAWMLPYVIGIAGAGVIVFTAKRWARHSPAYEMKPAAADPALNGRLDEELRDLD